MLSRDIAAKLGSNFVSSIPLEAIRNPDSAEVPKFQISSQPMKQRSSSDVRTAAYFCENGAAYGALGRFPGREVMGIIKDYMHSHA